MTILQPSVPEDRLADVNFGVVLKKLIARANFMVIRAPDIFDGVSAEDVVHDAFVEFFTDKGQLGWNPALGKLETFLWTVVRRMLLDRLRRGKHEISIQDDAVRIAAEGSGRLTSDPRNYSDLKDRVDYLKSFAVGDPELERLLIAAAEVDGPNINQEIAASLQTSTDAIVNLKRRLQRRIKAAEQRVEQI